MRVYLLGAYTPGNGFCEHAADVSQRKKTTRGVRALCGTKVRLRQFNAVYVRSYTCKKCALSAGKDGDVEP